jgi:hypothetical protein
MFNASEMSLVGNGLLYRLYVDETGSHGGCHPTDPRQRYFGLVGVVIRRDLHAQVESLFSDLKQRHLGCRSPCAVPFHRTDALSGSGAFTSLRDATRRSAFTEDLLALVAAAPFIVLAVAVDKLTHNTRTYRRLQDVYHYAMKAMLERYVLWLSEHNGRGDVVAEARGKKEDRNLREAYARTAHVGTEYVTIREFGHYLSQKQVSIMPKRAVIGGLELADLLAQPMTRDVLVAYKRIEVHGHELDRRIAHAAAGKYRRKNGRSLGYGQVLLD